MSFNWEFLYEERNEKDKVKPQHIYLDIEQLPVEQTQAESEETELNQVVIIELGEK